MQPGEAFNDGWQVNALKGVKSNRFKLEADNGITVLRIDSEASGSSLIRVLDIGSNANTVLRWRWRISNVIENGDIGTKEGDDFAARLYVLFEYRPEELSFAERAKLKIARLIYGKQLPATALCYVWGNASDVIGTSVWNAYSTRVRMVVLRNADSGIGEWSTEERNVAADFRAAFGTAPPRISALALATDTDQTGESVTSWFGDIEMRR